MPRWTHYAFAALFGLLAISLAIQSGWHSADALACRITFAALYGGIAAFAFYGHGIAADAWFDRHYFLGAMFFVVAGCAVVMTVFNDLGAIANRNDAMIGARKAAKDAAAGRRAELDRVTAERRALVFQPATDDSVQVARDAVIAAEKARVAECDRRGPYCRARESEEAAKRDALAQVLAAKASTDRATQLEAKAAALSAALTNDAAPASINPQATIVAHLTGGAADIADAWLQISLSAMLELCVAATMINLERIRRRADAGQPAPHLRQPTLPGAIPDFMSARLVRDHEASVGHREIVDEYKDWCASSAPQRRRYRRTCSAANLARNVAGLGFPCGKRVMP